MQFGHGKIDLRPQVGQIKICAGLIRQIEQIIPPGFILFNDES